MRRNGLLSLIFIVVLAVGGLAYTVVAENEPLLGLDLQGGISVVLQPVGEVEDPETISQAIEIIRQRIDGIGVAEPEIARQGDAIVVQLPGVQDRERALELVGQTAELRFRPVLQTLPPGLGDLDLGDGENGDTTTTVPGDDGSDPADDPSDTTDTTEPADDTTDTTDTTEPADDSTDPPETTVPADDPTDTTEAGFGLAPGESAAPLQTDDTTTTSSVPDDDTTTTTSTVPAQDAPVPGLEGLGLTPPEDDDADAVVTLGQFEDGVEVLRYRLGPTAATGDILSGADAQLQGLGTWIVSVSVQGGRIDEFNQIAGQCFNGTAVCPSRQLAIVLDGRVVSAPQINAPSFDSDGISISGSFTEGEAKDLALVLRYGSLPVELEPQQTQSVSATLGRDALDAGVTAGIVGLVLVFLYMVIYYRLLGVVAMFSLLISAALLWTVIAYLGSSQGLALTLAGVTGIIVSIGVAVDSNVVFYEHLKEDVSNGRSLRSAVDGSFASAFSTIVKADVASLIGAGILYWLTVGPVRGFAFYLGLSTILDLVSSYFFMRPLSRILVRSERLAERPHAFGMPRTAPEEVVPA